MPLQANAVLQFTGYFAVETGLMLQFVCLEPGPGEPTDYDVFVTDAEWTAAGNNTQRRALVLGKIQRRYRPIATLENFIGESFTIP